MINSYIYLINMIKIFNEDKHIIDMREINDNMHTYRVGDRAGGSDPYSMNLQVNNRKYNSGLPFKLISYIEGI